MIIQPDKGIGCDYGEIWVEFDIMPRNGRFLKIS